MSSIVYNRKSRFEYHLESTIEAGMMLLGHEVKSIKAGRIHISEAHIIIKNNKVIMIGCRIDPLPNASDFQYIDSERTIPLLLHKKEIERLGMQVKVKGMTIVPVDVHLSSNGKLKMSIALGKGKNQRDKRENIKKRDAERSMRSY